MISLKHRYAANIRPHAARVSMQFLAANNVNAMPWPALSPDMAPNEHVWDELGRRLYRRQHIQNLEAAFVQEWNQLPQAFFQNLGVDAQIVLHLIEDTHTNDIHLTIMNHFYIFTNMLFNLE